MASSNIARTVTGERPKDDMQRKQKGGGRMPTEPYKLSDTELATVIENLDETGGYLIKESELRFWIEHFVNTDRALRMLDEEAP